MSFETRGGSIGGGGPGRVNCSHFARGRAPRSAPLSKSARSLLEIVADRHELQSSTRLDQTVKFRPFFPTNRFREWNERYQGGTVSIRKIITAGFIWAKMRFPRKTAMTSFFYRCLSRLFLSFSYHGRLFLSISIFTEPRRRVFCPVKV